MCAHAVNRIWLMFIELVWWLLNNCQIDSLICLIFLPGFQGGVRTQMLLVDLVSWPFSLGLTICLVELSHYLYTFPVLRENLVDVKWTLCKSFSVVL